MGKDQTLSKTQKVLKWALQNLSTIIELQEA